jgi:two-component system, NarL family, sensor histidine kinase DevS
MDAVLMIEADIELSALLQHIVEEAVNLVGARYGALGVLNEERTRLEQFLTVGLDDVTEAAIGLRPTGRGVLGLLITDPQTLRLRDLSIHPEGYGFPAGHPPMTSFLGVPIRVRAGEVWGNLYLTDKQGGGDFGDEDEALAEALALAAGIAIENTRLHDRVRVLSVLEDRDRIAMALHDKAIQRLFAAGLILQGAIRLPEREQMAERVSEVVEDLDATITEIRGAIFELSDNAMRGGLRHGVLALASELAPTLGAKPQVSFKGPVDNTVPQHVADHVLAVVREALTNAGKYAQASHFVVTLSVNGDVILEIIDDGIGFHPSEERTGLGLGNMRNRAEKLGGTFGIRGADGGGTRITWRVPI